MVPQLVVRLSDFVAGDPVLPHALLLVVGGAARGEVIPVCDTPAVVGRSQDVELTVADETVSRRHAELRGDRECLELEDLGSSNGTTINGNPVAGALTLHDGDLVGLGSATLLVKIVH